jgi:hypothetical protein
MRQRGSESDNEFAQRLDRQSDKMLVPLDAYLELVQRQHLWALGLVGASGPQVPEVWSGHNYRSVSRLPALQRLRSACRGFDATEEVPSGGAVGSTARS